MNKNKFKHAFKKASKKVNKKKLYKEELRVQDKKPVYIGKKGTRNLIIVMEELAELQEQLIMYLEGDGDKLLIVEEMADVYIGLDHIKLICDISDKKISKCKNKKTPKKLLSVIANLSRLQKRISKFIRGKCDKDDLVEEISCVYKSLKVIKKKCGISDKKINKAINVKLNRLEETKGIYK